MTTLLVVTGNPSQYTAGNWPDTAMNSGTWRFTFTTTATSSSGTYGGFNALFSTPIIGGTSGGLWIVSERLELYDTDDNLVFASGAMVFGAGAVLTFTIDAGGAGGRSYSISGATSGNVSNVAFTDVGPYFRAGETLGAGETPGTGGFELPGTFGNITDGQSGESIDAAAGSFALTGADASLVASFTMPADAGTLALTGGAADLVPATTGATIDAEAGAFSLSGGGADLIAVARVAADAGAFALEGGDVELSPGSVITVGDHEVDAQPFPFSTRDALITLTTQASGSVVVLASGGKSSDITQAWTDNKSNTIRKLTAVQEYPDFGGYGTQVGITHNGMTGGSNHQFTIQVSNDDENTSFAVEVLNGRRANHLHVNDNNAGAGTTLGIGPITTDGPATLIAFWYGSAPVTPPFSGTGGPNGTGEGTPFTAVPDNGFAVVHSYLHNFEFGQVQGACAVREVGAAGSYSVTWTHSPSQGAQLWLIAVEGDAAVGADAGAFALTGGQATLDASANPTINADAGSFVLTGAEAALQGAAVVTADAVAFAVAGGSADLVAVAEIRADAAALALTGGDASLLAGARVVADAAAFTIAGGDAGIVNAAVVSAESGAFLVTGGQAGIEGAGDQSINADAGSFSLTGGEAELVALATIQADPGSLVMTGGVATLEIQGGIPPTPLPSEPEPGSFDELVAEMDRDILDILGS